MTTTHTRTHVFITFANPYLKCDECGASVIRWHDDDQCGCAAGSWNEPCHHKAGVTSVCPSWGPVDGCQCKPIYSAASLYRGDEMTLSELIESLELIKHEQGGDPETGLDAVWWSNGQLVWRIGGFDDD